MVSADGAVESVTAERLVVVMQPEGGDARRQTYTLKGKNTYVRSGDRFKGEVSILAGAPKKMADISTFLEQKI